jgi:hypothetical protein
MRITIEFDDDRDDEVIDIMREADCGDGTSRCLVDSDDITLTLNHHDADGPVALVERAIFKLRRAGLK